MTEDRSREDWIQSYILEYSETDCGWLAEMLAEMLVDAEDQIKWLIEEKIMPPYIRNLLDMHRTGVISTQEIKSMADKYRQNLYKGK